MTDTEALKIAYAIVSDEPCEELGYCGESMRNCELCKRKIKSHLIDIFLRMTHKTLRLEAEEPNGSGGLMGGKE